MVIYREAVSVSSTRQGVRRERERVARSISLSALHVAYSVPGPSGLPLPFKDADAVLSGRPTYTPNPIR